MVPGPGDYTVPSEFGYLEQYVSKKKRIREKRVARTEASSPVNEVVNNE